MGEMPGKPPLWIWLALPLAYLLYFYHLDGTGLLSADEPRYASIGREMADSGDWLTPRLWGHPWFEKPPLLYWMTATGFRLRLGPELAPRLPVAVLAVLFLAFFAWVVGREFGHQPATLATLILGTCLGWVGFSQIAVTDLPLTVAFSSAMLLALPWVAKGDTRRLPAVGALLGLAVLAKGLVPVVLAVPLLFRRRARDLLRGRVVAPFLAVSLPWYLLCYLRNGNEFLRVFFWQQQLSRLFSGALLHVRPPWFYIPVIAGGLLPWLPLVGLLARPAFWRDPRCVFLLWCVLFGLAFFSVSTTKLPGYVLPLVPALAAVMGLELSEVANPRPWLAASALLLVAFPVAAQVLAAAVGSGLSHALWPQFEWAWLLPVLVAAGVCILGTQRVAATLLVSVCATAGIVAIKAATLPELDRSASARGLWRAIELRADSVCVADIQAKWRYGLNYYSVKPLPDCRTTPKPLEVRQTLGQPPYLASGGNGDTQLGVPGRR